MSESLSHLPLMKAQVLGALLFLVVIPLVFIGVDRLVALPWYVDTPLLRATSIPLALLGALFTIWSNVVLVRHAHGSALHGAGLSVGPQSRVLLVDGPYRLCANPMLFGITCLYLALAFAMDSMSVALLSCLFLAFMIWEVKTFEVPRLRRDFGEAYEHYRSRTPFLIPGLL